MYPAKTLPPPSPLIKPKRNPNWTGSSRKSSRPKKKTEDQIAALEERDAEIDTLLASPEVATDVGKCIKLSKEKAQISEELAALYETWEELAED